VTFNKKPQDFKSIIKFEEGAIAVATRLKLKERISENFMIAQESPQVSRYSSLS